MNNIIHYIFIAVGILCTGVILLAFVVGCDNQRKFDKKDRLNDYQ